MPFCGSRFATCSIRFVIILIRVLWVQVTNLNPLYDGFNGLTIDAATVTFAGANVLCSTSEDVNGDGRMDMVFHFNTEDLNLDFTSTVAILTGKTVDKKSISGEDSVNIVPKNK